MHYRLIILVALVVFGLQSPASTQQTEDWSVTTPSSSFAEHEFGSRLAISGEWCAVSDAIDNYYISGNHAGRLGSVNMYRREPTGWVFHQTILPPLPPPLNQYFTPIGVYVALEGHRLVLGGIVDAANNGAGTVWIYEFNGVDWVITTRLDPVIHRSGLYFGYGVRLAGEDLYVSVLRLGVQDPLYPNLPGGIIERYTHANGNWTLSETVEPVSTALPPRLCSERMALDGHVMVTVCDASDYHGWNDPYLRIYEGGPGAWVETAIVPGVQYPGSQDEYYGVSLDVWGDWIAVGAPLLSWDTFNPPHKPGQVFLYHRTAPGAWVLQQTIRASNSWYGTVAGGIPTTDNFGLTLDFDAGRLLVGARHGKNGAGQRFYGQAYLFEHDGTQWVETTRFGSAVGEASQVNSTAFATSVAIDGPYIVAGDPIAPVFPNSQSPRPGRAYFYEHPIGQVTCTGVPHSGGLPARLAARGSDSAHVGVIDFEGNDLPFGSPVLLIGGSLAGFVPNPGGSLGNLCVTGAMARLTTGTGPADFIGRWYGTVELPDPSAGGAFHVTTGSTWHFQLWYRQPGNPPASNFSSGLAIAFD